MTFLKLFARTRILAALCIFFNVPAAHADSVSISGDVVGKGIIIGLGTYEVGSQVTLRAVPQVDWRFDRWNDSVEMPSERALNFEASTNLHISAVMLPNTGEGRFTSGNLVGWGSGDFGRLNLPLESNTFVDCAAGWRHGLALRKDGTVRPWGWNGFGQTNVPSGLTNVNAVAAGGMHSLALKADGTVIGWGDNSNGQTNIPPELSNVIQIAAGYSHSLALQNDGIVVGWGANFYGQVSVPIGLRNVRSIAAGYAHSLALTGDGKVVAWGWNEKTTQSGSVYSGQADVPLSLEFPYSISAGIYHSVALNDDGVVAWGDNQFGQGRQVDKYPNIVQLVSGWYHNLARLDDGTIFGWGDYTDYQSGSSGPLKGVVKLSAGHQYSVAVTATNLAFIKNSARSRGVETVSPESFIFAIEVGAPLLLRAETVLSEGFQWLRNAHLLPAATNGFLHLSQSQLSDSGVYQLVAMNDMHAFVAPPTEVAVYDSETVGSGRVDFGRKSDPQTLVVSAVADPNWKFDHWEGDLSGTNIRQTVIFGGNKLSLLAKAVFVPTGKVTINATVSGEGLVLGSGTFDAGREITLRAVPQVDWKFDHWEGVPVELATNNPLIIEASAGLGPQAVMMEAPGAGRFQGGAVVAWGYGSAGQTTVPAGLSNVTAVAGGMYHTVALKNDGTVAAWGGRSIESSQTNVPQNLTGVVAIAAGWEHTVALGADGTVAVWGNNEAGQTNVPPGLNGVIAIAAAGQTVALKKDGKVVAWGDNQYGQANVPSWLPPAVLITAGYTLTVVVEKAGPVVAWGDNFFGQRNVPPNLGELVAISVGDTHTAALKPDDTVVSWGYGPTNIPPDLRAVAIAAGGGHTVALKRDGTVVAWGYNQYGQTDVPPSLRGVVAIAAGHNHTIALKAYRLGLVSNESSNLFRESGQSFRLAPFITLATSFQWYRNGQAMPGATSNTYEVAASSLSDSGSYQLLAMNAADALLTPPFILKVLPAGTPQLGVDGEITHADTIRGDSSTLGLSTSYSNGTIQYTFDGSAPGFDSPSYTVPVKVTNSVIVRALAYSSDFTQSAELSPIIVRIVPTHQLVTTTSGGLGNISFNPAKSRYLEDEVVTIKAAPSVGYRFVRWEGAVSGSYPEQQVVMSADKQVQAIFAAIPKFALATSVPGGGFIKGNTDSPYYVGTALSLQAVSSNGWQFLQWEGDVTADDTNATVLMDATKTVSAAFATDLALSVAGAGHLQLEPSSGPYPYGSKVRLTPVPDPGNYLALWGSIAAGQPKTAIEVTITNTGMLVSAIFAPLPTNKFTITAVAGSGGKVSSSPADGAYINGQVVMLTAQPDLGFEFVGWSGDVIDTVNPLSVIANSNKTIQASFRRTGGDLLTLTTTATGQGRIARTPDLGGYEAGTQVILEAIPASNWAFGSWNDSATTNPRRVITISSNTAISATFLPKYILATETSGEGTVLLSPPDGTYVAGTLVTATASPSSGSGFVGWSGDLDGTVPQSTLTMTNNKRIVATFARLGTLTTLVKGSGTVSRDPVQDQYLPGSIVQLTAISDAGYQFSGWSGAATGAANPLSFKVDKATAVIANFVDIAPPVVTIESPIAGSTNDERFVLSGTASDNSGSVQCTWQWNEVDQGDLVLSNGRFEILGLDLHPGDNRIRVIAKDVAGNQASADRLITWAPLRTVAVRDAVEVQEGKRMDFAVELESTGDVGSMNLLLHYDPIFLADPEWTWSSIAGSSINTLTTNVQGEVRATFSLAGGSVRAGTQSLAQVSFRARSVPATVTTELSVELLDSADAQGNKFSFGSATIAGSGRILPRRILGDNNANDRLDIGDCTLIQRLLTGLAEVRSWDVTANDLNASGDLDSGDATKALRIVVGLDSQPAVRLASQRSKFQAQPATSSAEKVLLLANPTQPTVGEKVTVQVILTNIATPLSGVSFGLDYPTNALRLTGSNSLSAGAVVPSNARVLWNVLPNQANFSTQSGKVLSGLSTATGWPARNGTLAQFEFQVQPGITSQASWPIRASNLEITGDGFDTRVLSDSLAAVTSGAVIPPTVLQIVQPLVENGQLKFRAMGTAGVHALIQSSSDADTWIDGGIFQIPAAGINQSIPIVFAAPKMFFRLKQAP